MKKIKILLIEDDTDLFIGLKDYLGVHGYELTTVPTGKEGLELLDENNFSLALLDLNLPDINGIEVLERMQEEDINVPTIVITGFHSVESAVQAMKLGAEDYLKKPLSPVELRLIIDRVMEKFSMEREITYLQSQLRLKYKSERFIGKSPEIKRVLEIIKKVAVNDQTTVLLTGESGTGKTLVAQLIHDNSPRNEKPFVNVTCSAISEQLLESELMGHKKGAFTDAVNDKMGLLELADTGTLFLDEIGDMHLSLQAKILKVLEEKIFRRVGGIKDIRVDTRIIAATNKDLELLVQENKFRDDLYYRLNVIPIKIPSLRERMDDIPLLVDFFIKRFNSELGRDIKGVRHDAMQLLKGYYWPGNLRELRNVIERSVLLSNGNMLDVQDLPESIRRMSEINPEILEEKFKLPLEGVELDQIEKNLILQALERSHGNVSRAARLLSIPRDKMRYRIKKYGIDLHKIII